ncbi:MAG: hypothetical protein ACE5GN_00615 [Waddliaceae bacterium]
MKKIKRGPVRAQMGVFCAIPVLFTLMAASGAFYATNLLAVVSETTEVRRAGVENKTLDRKVQVARDRSRELEQEISLIGRKVGEMRREREKASVAFKDKEKLDRTKKGYSEIQASRIKKADRNDQLVKRITEVESRLKNSRESERAFDILHKELAVLEQKDAELLEEKQEIEKQINTVQRAVNDKESVHAKDLVPAGSLQKAVFIECEEKWIRIMPEGKHLESGPSKASREEFLQIAKTTGYVVFLIRPDGYASFENYREVVENYNKEAASPLEFGYEPIDADWKLAYPSGEEKRI